MNLLSLIFLFVFLCVLTYAQQTYSTGGDSDQLCSSMNPKPNETCVSVKFPWMSYEVYFCTGTEYHYKQCNPPPDNSCYMGDSNTTQIQLQGPWNCCPQITQTDPCESYPCYQLPPYNRTYITWSYDGSCCDTYFTGPGDSYSSCNYSACPPAPENMTDVTYIYDNYGCCTYYQLQGDSKPGYCPPPYDVYYYGDGGTDGGIGSYPSQYDSVRYCIGDYTCPDDEKCCPLYSYGSTYQCTNATFTPPSTTTECVRLQS